jgi:hypothetical protein
LYIPTTQLTQSPFPPPGYELDYTQITVSAGFSSTTAAAADTIVALPARVYNGTTIVLLEFYTPSLQTGAGAGTISILNLWDDTTDLGRIVQIRNTVAAQSLDMPVYVARRLTPSAASHTYIIKGWRVTANGTVTAGAGGVDVTLPAFLRATVVSA